MFWSVRHVERGEGDVALKPSGRFVLHRHVDGDGPHLDLRLEGEGYLVGYRIGVDGGALDTGDGIRDAEYGIPPGAWATEKMPHPLAWLEADGDAVREDAGVYAVRSEGAGYRELELHGDRGVRVVRFEREAALDAGAARDVALALRDVRASATQAAMLVRDGAAARGRAMERLCGLGRELDGGAFDESQWRRMLAGLTLDEVHGQLRAFEARFDGKYPPAPVSRPEPLDEAEDAERVLALARG